MNAVLQSLSSQDRCGIEYKHLGHQSFVVPAEDKDSASVVILNISFSVGFGSGLENKNNGPGECRFVVDYPDADKLISTTNGV